MLNTLVPRPRGPIKVKKSAIIVLGEGIAGATQRRPLAVDVGILVQGDVDDLSVFGNRWHRFKDFASFFVAPEFRQTLGLDFHEATAQFIVSCGRKRSEGIVDDHESHVGLSEIRTCTGGHENQLNLLGKIKGRGIGSVDNLNGLLRMAETALGICLNRA